MAKVVGYDEFTGYPIFEEEKEEKSKKESIRQQLEDIQGDICDNFCKYRSTCDENCECEWVREGNSCPLDKI
jgi:hypothetical protein